MKAFSSRTCILKIVKMQIHLYLTQFKTWADTQYSVDCVCWISCHWQVFEHERIFKDEYPLGVLYAVAYKIIECGYFSPSLNLEGRGF